MITAGGAGIQLAGTGPTEPLFMVLYLFQWIGACAVQVGKYA